MPTQSVQIPALPSIEESIDDCTYLFAIFRDSLEKHGNAGIVAIRLEYGVFLPEALNPAVEALIRIVGKNLSGRIAGTYKSGVMDFYLLLIPAGSYNDTLFMKDLRLIKAQLKRLQGHPLMNRQILPLGSRREISLKVEGVFLNNRIGESSDNALFRAFHDLFGAPLQTGFAQSHDIAAVEEIIHNELITPLFQQIVDLGNGTVYGYESLSRISSPGLISNSEELFAKASQYDLVAPLEILCRKKALWRAKELGLDGRLFLNVSPLLLQAKDHGHGVTRNMLDEMNLGLNKVVFELSERTNIEDYDLLLKGVNYYRRQGYSIAIDDLGSGYAGLQMLAEVEPEYVKLARSLISFIDKSTTKQALVESIAMFCNRIGSLVIAEGIERPEELAYLKAVGIHMGQGYLLAKPSETGC
ncbi:MAG: EAL domain-containing protein [Geobacter sp.]|nr:EAL domain-containing protein [Geobacter sp.]